MMHDWDRYWDHGLTGTGWLMGVLMILLTVAVIVAIVFLVRGLRGSPASDTTGAGGTPVAPESPQDIVKRRYAAGEIDREEYLQKLKDL